MRRWQIDREISAGKENASATPRDLFSLGNPEVLLDVKRFFRPSRCVAPFRLVAHVPNFFFFISSPLEGKLGHREWIVLFLSFTIGDKKKEDRAEVRDGKVGRRIRSAIRNEGKPFAVGKWPFEMKKPVRNGSFVTVCFGLATFRRWKT